MTSDEFVQAFAPSSRFVIASLVIFLRRRSFRGVEIRIHRRVVVHLELAVDLQPLPAGEDVVEQLAQRRGQVAVLLVEDFQPGLGLGDVARRWRRCGRPALPCDTAAGRGSTADRSRCRAFRCSAARRPAGCNARRRQARSIRQSSSRSIRSFRCWLSLSIARFTVGQVGVAHVGAAGDVLLVPQAEVLLVLKADHVQETPRRGCRSPARATGPRSSRADRESLGHQSWPSASPSVDALRSSLVTALPAAV